MFYDTIKEITQNVRLELGRASKPLEDEKEYQQKSELHQEIKALIEVLGELDQQTIDLIDEYDALEFKKSLGIK